jgi:hypothetical protein
MSIFTYFSYVSDICKFYDKHKFSTYIHFFTIYVGVLYNTKIKFFQFFVVFFLHNTIISFMFVKEKVVQTNKTTFASKIPPYLWNTLGNRHFPERYLTIPISYLTITAIFVRCKTRSFMNFGFFVFIRTTGIPSRVGVRLLISCKKFEVS